MVRRSLNGRKSVNYHETENSEEEAASSDISEETPPSNSGSGKSKRKSIPKKRRITEEGTDEEIEESEPSDSNNKRRSSGRKVTPQKSLKDEDSEDDGYEEEIEVEYVAKKQKRASNGRAKKKPGKQSKKVLSKAQTGSDDHETNEVSKNGKLPSVSEMVIGSIRALRDSPRQGSSFSSIKQEMSRRWGLNIQSYVGKIKKYIENAEKTGEIIRTKGKGFNARFTVPGMKKKKKGSSSKLTKKYDHDEVEYVPAKTQRDEERLKDKEELEKRREERAAQLAKALEDKAAEPKKVKPKKEFYEVKCIQGTKIRDGINYYLVKYEGSYKPQWEPEENVQNCWDLVEMFLKEDELRKAEIKKMHEENEAKGEYEVQRILKMAENAKEGTREFLIRWKGYSASEDTWEKEEDLNCLDLIKAFIEKVEESKGLGQKSLRTAPKPIDRLTFYPSGRVGAGKRSKGTRVTYVDME